MTFDSGSRLQTTSNQDDNNYQPWFNTTTKSICRRKVRSYKKAKRTNKDRDWKRYRRLKKQAQTYNKYINDIVCSEPGASRRLGAFIKANRCDQTGVAPPPPP